MEPIPDKVKEMRRRPAILSGLQYKVDDSPPWPTTILLGFQHYLLLLSSNLATPGIMATVICAEGNKHVTSELLGNMLFACGIGTLIQTFLGARLPIVQCPAYAYIVPMLAMNNFDKWACPSSSQVKISENSTNHNVGFNGTDTANPLWMSRLNTLTGSLMVAAVFEIVVGASGLLSILLRFIGPLTVAPTIMMMGLGVAETGFELAGKHWGISVGTIVMIVILSECLPSFTVRRSCELSNGKCSQRRTEVVLHKMFSVIISVCVMWLLCFVLTVTDVLPSNDKGYGYEARTDLRTEVLYEASWVSFPYPGKYGMPDFSSGMFIGMIAGVVTSVIESIGDYYTCARIAGALPPPPSAVNRGIMVEGIDCILAVVFGAGFGVTSCSQNIGVISLTKVGSRRVVLVAGALMMLFGCFSKMSAFVVTVPDPIIGAAFIVLFGVLAAVGASNLQYVDLNSSRNMVVFGMSLFLGLALPGWLKNNQDLFHTMDPGVNQILVALLGNSMFMACFSALVLDNFIPGTDGERGIVIWRMSSEDDDSSDGSIDTSMTLKTYDFPWGMKFIRKWQWTRYVPFMPTFMGIDKLCPCLQWCPHGTRSTSSLDTEIDMENDDDEEDDESLPLGPEASSLPTKTVV